MSKLVSTLIFTWLSVLLFAQLNSNFSASSTVVCLGEEITFTDLSTPAGTVISWAWDFGDGNSSNVQNPSHTYSAAGTYTVILTANDGTTSDPEVKINYILVHPLPNPSFAVSTPSSCTLPASVTISNVQPGSGATYNWDFGNGQTSTAQNPTAPTYATAGSYTITLLVTNTSTGCENSFSQNVDINEYFSDFDVSALSVCEGTAVSFTNLSSPGTNSWSWDFGNGNSSTQQNPSVTYFSPGTYTVTLTSQNTTIGCQDVSTMEIEVLANPTPTMEVSPNSGCAPLEVTLTNTSGGAAGDYTWDFGDGNSFTGANPGTHTYTDNGSYTITISLTDANGCTGSQTYNNIVIVSGIQVDFEADVLNGCEVLEVNFSESSVSPNPTDDPLVSWVWDFGNGSTFTGQNPPTQFYSEGIYDVTLTVTSANGCSQTLTLEEYIQVGIPPDVDFSFTPPTECAKEDFDFTNLTVIGVPHEDDEVNYFWDFGDGGTSTEENPTHTYPTDTGFFDVQLIVEFRGCADTLIIENAVYIDAPISIFSTTTVYCNPTLPLEVTFDDEAIIGKVTDDAEMIWSWGDGSPDEVVLPPALYNNNPGSVTHTYTSYGTFTIQQTIYNYTTGCSDSTTQTIHITQVEADLIVANDSVCVLSAFNLSSNSTSTHAITQNTYNMGNGSTISGQNTTFTYSNPGNYVITLTTTNQHGCQDTDSFQIEALSLPQPVITPSAISGCSPLTVVFNNNSTSQSGVPLESFLWTFENGSTQSTSNVGDNVSYTFTNEGSFITSLLVIDEFGCSNAIATSTTITKPTANFTAPAIVCNNTEFIATNTSSNYASSEWFVNGSPTSTDNNLSTLFNFTSSPTNVSFVNNITLIVTDVNGCKDTVDIPVTISAPNANFDYVFNGANTNANGDFTCPPVFATLTDLSNSFGDITGWSWDFGDGKFSTLQNPNNTYVFAGTYTGTLTITDEYGCQDSISFVDYLTIGGPTGEFDWVPVGDACDPQYQFIPSNLNGAVNIIWNFGDGASEENLSAFTYAYPGPGTFSPTATIVDENGCNVTYELDDITIIFSTVTAFFEGSPLIDHWGEPFTIVDQSTGGSGGIVNWTWISGEDQFSNNGGVFDYYFNESGQVIMTLIVTDALGCSDSYSVVVNVTANLTIPNVLTPNGDGSNDVLRLINNSYKNYEVVILNRWGNVMSRTFVEEDNYLWDGRNKGGNFASDGVYFYKITGIERDGNPRTEHGFVHLVIDK
jgi:gliding motility-associated-like protein